MPNTELRTRHALWAASLLSIACEPDPEPAYREFVDVGDPEVPWAIPRVGVDNASAIPRNDASLSRAPADAGVTDAADEGPVAVCGDREVGRGEQCDDGNDVDDDGCNDDCHESAGLLWAHDDEANVSATTMVVDDAGAIAVGGSEIVSDGNYDLWVHKYTTEGVAAWPRPQTLSVGLDEGATAIAFAPGGDVVVQGSSQVSGSRAESAMLLMKHAGSDGARRWPAPVRAMAGEEHIGNALWVAASQHIYTAATFRRDGRFDVWLQKYDTAGSAAWPSAVEQNEGLGEFPGAFWLASESTLRTYWAATPGPQTDLVLADVSISDGSVTTRHAPLSALPIANPLFFAVDAQGGVVVCANILMGERRVLWVQKFSTDGMPAWANEVIETADDDELVCGAVALDFRGNVAVIAYLGSPSSRARIWLRLYTADGQPRWRTPIVYGGGYEALPAGVGFDPDGNVIAAGVRRTVENYSFLWLAKYAR